MHRDYSLFLRPFYFLGKPGSRKEEKKQYEWLCLRGQIPQLLRKEMLGGETKVKGVS